jgi:hypothetical protein
VGESLYFGVQFVILGASQALRLSERPFYRARRASLRGLVGWSLPRANRVERLATSGEVLSAEASASVRPFVEWNLRLLDSPRRFLADGLLPTLWLLWLGVYPTVVGVSRGQWGLVTFGLGELVLGLGLVLFLVRRNARFRRTAAVNGWPMEAAA